MNLEKFREVLTSHVLHTVFGFTLEEIRNSLLEKSSLDYNNKTFIVQSDKQGLRERITFAESGNIVYYRWNEEKKKYDFGRIVFKYEHLMRSEHYEFVLNSVSSWYFILNGKRNKRLKNLGEIVTKTIKIEVSELFLPLITEEIQKVIDRYKNFTAPYLTKEEEEILLQDDERKRLEWFDSLDRDKRISVILWSNQHMEGEEGQKMGYDPTAFLPKPGDDLDKFDRDLREFFFAGFILDETIEW